jgi:cardiolipin synthase
MSFALAVLLTVLGVLLVSNLSLGNKRIDKQLPRLFAVADAQFERAAASMLTPALVPGNTATDLLNGDQIFPRMLGAIRGARESITLETYIYFSGETGGKFSDALRERAENGVQVLVLLDWIGGELEDELLERMRASGVQIHRYNPPRWYSMGYFNNRTHRKLMVVDGMTGFIGGVGLADKWSGNAQDPAHWRDTHFEVVGPVVGQMQSAFADNWLQASGDVLLGVEFFPALEAAGTMKAQVFTAAPAGGSKNMQLLYLLSITAAAKSIDLSAAYFIPDEVARQALVAAAQRGVKVRVIVPGPHMDVALVRHASRAGWGPLLESGVEIHEFQPTMFHCKVIVVDDLWTSVGSTNFDARSFSVNDEANMNILDASFAQRQREIFEQDLQQSKLVRLEDWRGRSAWMRFLDWSAALASSQL